MDTVFQDWAEINVIWKIIMRKRLELERVTKNANVTCSIKTVSILKGSGFDRAF
jgi:hypothetical protein